MNGRPWYKRFPTNFLAGTSELTVEEKGAYSVIIDLLYDRHGPIPNDTQWLGRVMGCSTRRAGLLVERLMEKGKVSFTKDGELTCVRAIERMEHDAPEQERVHTAAVSGGQALAAKNRGKIPDKSQINPGKIRDKSEINSPEDGDFNDLAKSSACHTRGKRLDSTQTPSESEGAQARVTRPPPDRGSRLKPDWRPSADGIAFAKERGLDPHQVLEAFRDYWIAASGRTAVKLDWEAAWRTWCRREAERRPVAQRPTSQLSLLQPITGGRADANSDPNDHWGIDAFCKSIGASLIVDPKVLALGKGRWGWEGIFLDGTAIKIAEAAGFPKSWRGDWSLMASWIKAGFRSESIVPAVKQLAEFFASRGEPARTLKVFDRKVMERQAA